MDRTNASWDSLLGDLSIKIGHIDDQDQSDSTFHWGCGYLTNMASESVMEHTLLRTLSILIQKTWKKNKMWKKEIPETIHTLFNIYTMFLCVWTKQ